MSRHLKACLVGCGRMGATIDDEVRDRPDSWLWLPYSHAAGYTACDRTALVAVSDMVAEKAEAIRQRYNVPKAYTDYREMIEKEQPDIVSIATRPTPYAEICIFAAEHGVKGIYCEKPLARSMEEADSMVEACEKHGVKFNYGTQRRYAPLYRRIRALLDAGELGNVQCVVAYCGASAALWGLTHMGDMLLCLAGDPEVDFVQGTVIAKDEDWQGHRLNVDPPITNGYVRFKNGVHAYSIAGGPYEFEVVGSKGVIRTQTNGTACQWRRGESRNEPLELAQFPEFERKSGTLCLIEDLVDAIETGRETLGPIRLARRSFEIIMGFIESSRQGGARVPMPMANRKLYVGRPDW